MTDLDDGESTQVKGSGSSVYTLKNSGGVYSCTCPAWRNQSEPIERRSCKHLRRLRGDEAEQARTGTARPVVPAQRAKIAGSGASTGNLSQEPPLLLAHRWETDVDLAGWWLSEKLDGVRAYWDGDQFVSRLGNVFHAPDWFTAGMPRVPLDGELWGGRKQFQRTVGIVKRQDKSPLWRDLLYVVFDAPTDPSPFEGRIEYCKTILSQLDLPYLRVHEHDVCRGHDHLREELARVEGLGGEGLMARRPGSLYEAGRSNTLLKVKTFRDAEARVIAYAAGAGRHAGRVGALIAELQDGTRFNIGTGLSDAERESPPSIGSLVTFRYQELSDGGVPRFPSYVGVRIDARWSTTARPTQPSSPELCDGPAMPLSSPTPPAQDEVSGAPTNTTAVARHFELADGKSSKFWEARLDGVVFSTRYGKIGTNGQTTVKELSSPDAGRKEYEKAIAEKVKKGYTER